MTVTKVDSRSKATQTAVTRKAFAKELCRARKKATLTMTDVGKAIGVSGTRVSQWERAVGLPSAVRYAKLRELLSGMEHVVPLTALRTGKVGGRVPGATATSKVGAKKKAFWSRTLLKTLVDVAKNDETMAVLQTLLRAAKAEHMSVEDLIDVLWGDVE